MDDRILTALLKSALRYALCAVALWTAKTAFAKDFTEDYRGDRTSWQIQVPRTAGSVRDHRRIRHPRTTQAYEFIHIAGYRDGVMGTLETQLPHAAAIEDLKLTLWWNSAVGGAVLSLRVVFPQHREPGTDRPLSALIAGDRYTTPGKWQKLTAQVSTRQVQARIRELREFHRNPRIASDGMYVSAAVIMMPLRRGSVHSGIATTSFGPIVSPTAVKPATVPRRHSTPLDTRKQLVEFRLDRLRVDGYPFFPRIAAYHRERPEDLRDLGLNVIWVPRYDDTTLTDALSKQGLWLTATPPDRPDESKAALIQTKGSLQPSTSPILFWNVGTQIPETARPRLIDWIDRIRKADRRFDRPILGDVTNDERVFSRHISMLGCSRHILHTEFSFRQYRDWLIQKRQLARPGTFMWTWIQTEASIPGQRGQRVIEPEQIRLQVYAALAAGCRGIGYWKTTPWDSKDPGAPERRLAVSQLNLELDLLSPWLSTGTIVGTVPFKVFERADAKIGQGQIDFHVSPAERRQRNALIKARADHQAKSKRWKGELEATIIRSEFGTLLLPVWYESGAQYTPGQMAANNATIVVQGISESASAWLVTTTGVKSLARERVAGGIQITIPKYDQTAAVVLTSKRSIIDQLRARVKKMASISAEVSVQLATEKLKRVRAINSRLEALGKTQPDAPQLLHRAGTMVSAAQSALDGHDYHTARTQAENGMQLLRILQRAHWNDAARQLIAPVATPYAVCFQSLPEHWEFLQKLKRSTPGKGNLLRSGNFEDIDTMLAEGWKHSQNTHPAVRAVAELYPKGKEGSYSLRLVAAPIAGKEPPAYLPKRTVAVTSPKLVVRSGQIVEIRGWVNVATPIVGNVDAAMLYDSLTGKKAALRWQKGTGWKRFTLLREVNESGTIQLTLALNGMGEIRFDDLQVLVHNPVEQPPGGQKPATTTPPRNPTLLDRLPRLPSIPGWSRSQ